MYCERIFLLISLQIQDARQAPLALSFGSLRKGAWSITWKEGGEA